MIQPNIETNFNLLCEMVEKANIPTAGQDEVEPSYEKLLEFLADHPKERVFLSQKLIEIMSEYRFVRGTKVKLLPSAAIAYCMHELRWPEIYEFAKKENIAFYSKKMETLMTDIMSAYDDSWDDRDFYKRFQML